MAKPLEIIGNNALITIAGVKNVPAKIDTGANLSSVWVSNTRITPEGNLEYSLFGPSCPLYTGERLIATNFRVQRVKNSTGHVQIRYLTTLPITLHGRKIKATFTFANRSTNKFPVLIGRRTIQNKFLVDVSQVAVNHSHPIDSSDLTSELKANPLAFHQKYFTK